MMDMLNPGIGNNPGKGTCCEGCLHIFDCKKLQKFRKSSKVTDLCQSAQERRAEKNA